MRWCGEGSFSKFVLFCSKTHLAHLRNIQISDCIQELLDHVILKLSKFGVTGLKERTLNRDLGGLDFWVSLTTPELCHRHGIKVPCWLLDAPYIRRGGCDEMRQAHSSCWVRINPIKQPQCHTEAGPTRTQTEVCWTHEPRLLITAHALSA